MAMGIAFTGLKQYSVCIFRILQTSPARNRRPMRPATFPDHGLSALRVSAPEDCHARCATPDRARRADPVAGRPVPARILLPVPMSPRDRIPVDRRHAAATAPSPCT
ncbi:MAG: hypothetical protein KJ018_05680 [Burkholderiales bacterium]|nr:hypothetical protein [Burkholderiales bacterium]